jgi:uncharacterized RDD family membrane protein YckC
MTAPNEQLDWGHWIYRLIALIIDSIIISIPAYIIYWLAILPFVSVNVNYGFGVVMSVPPWWIGLLFPLILGVIELFYFMILDTAWGGTIGKRIMGLQVQTVNGGKVPFGKSLLRNISKIYGLLLLIDWLIGIITPGDKRQKYMDRVAGTIVMRKGAAFAFTGSNPPPPPPPT